MRRRCRAALRALVTACRAGDAGAARIGAQAGAQRARGAGALARRSSPTAGPTASRPSGSSRQRAAVLAALPDGTSLPAPALAKAAGVGTGVVQAMARDGLLAAVPLIERPSWPRPDPDRAGVELTPAQRAAASELCRAGRARGGRGPARRRAGRRQDRGLFRGGGRSAARRPARARPAARDRALGPVAGPLRAPLRHRRRRSGTRR